MSKAAYVPATRHRLDRRPGVLRTGTKGIAAPGARRLTEMSGQWADPVGARVTGRLAEQAHRPVARAAGPAWHRGDEVY